MIFEALSIPGAFLIRPEPAVDERGHFARTWCADAFAERGLDARFLQAGVSFNHRRGTLRGLHYQAAPCEETKLVRCSAGAIFDVLVDVRPDSPARGSWLGLELSRANGLLIYVPAGVAHGFQTLTDDAEVSYQIGGARYSPAHARGLRYDDPAIAIAWPLPVTCLSDRDLAWPAFDATVGSRPC